MPADNRQTDTGLAEVIAAWPGLPTEARRRVLAIVRAATTPAEDHKPAEGP